MTEFQEMAYASGVFAHFSFQQLREYMRAVSEFIQENPEVMSEHGSMI